MTILARIALTLVLTCWVATMTLIAAGAQANELFLGFAPAWVRGVVYGIDTLFAGYYIWRGTGCRWVSA